MKSSDEAINNATSNAILVMLAVLTIPMIGFLGMIARVIIRERNYRKVVKEAELSS